MSTEPAPQDTKDGERTKRLKRIFDLRTYFVTGLVVAAPIAITIYLTVSFVTFVDSQVARVIPDRWEISNYLPVTIPGIGVMLVFIALVLLGAFTANVAGRWVLSRGERLLHRMPVIRNVYSALKQIFETVLAKSDQSFQQVALVEYPRRDIWAVAFVTSATKGEIQVRSDTELVSLFLPTTPNPTSGFLLFAPRKDVVILDMTVEEGAKMVISGGLVVPEYKGLADNAIAAHRAGGGDGAARGTGPALIADRAVP